MNDGVMFKSKKVFHPVSEHLTPTLPLTLPSSLYQSFFFSHPFMLRSYAHNPRVSSQCRNGNVLCRAR